MFVRMVVFKRVAGYLLRSESPRPDTFRCGTSFCDDLYQCDCQTSMG